MGGVATPVDSPTTWAEISSSPVALPALPTDALARQALARCGAGEAGLAEAARRAVARVLRGLPVPDASEIAFAQRSAGEPHPWARAWTAHAKTLAPEATVRKLLRELGTGLAEDTHGAAPGLRRCAVASGTGADGTQVIAVVAVEALADLAPLPTRGRTGQWITVEAILRTHADGGSVIVLDPTGMPRRVPTWFDGTTVRARFVLSRPGAFAVQVVTSTAAGPRPVLEANVFADVQPPVGATHAGGALRGDPGGQAAALDRGDDADALTKMLTDARSADGEPPLTRDPRLDRVARAHALRMAALRVVAHDAGDGDPVDRLGSADLAGSATGENVAHAPSVALAHAALWASPSHRANILRRDFDRVGVAAVRDEHGDVWVVETFTTGAR